MLTCCYCGQPATGRYCFLNQDDGVVDNPFCVTHSTEVWRQTKRGLEHMHPSSAVAREYFLLQRWGTGEVPAMPKDKQELLSKGGLLLH